MIQWKSTILSIRLPAYLRYSRLHEKKIFGEVSGEKAWQVIMFFGIRSPSYIQSIREFIRFLRL
jgi:hypothetical protein